jgi:hypothetical protein
MRDPFHNFRTAPKALSEECARVLSEAATDSAIGDILREAGELLSDPYQGGSYKDIGLPKDRPQSLVDVAMLQGSLFEDFPLEGACMVHLSTLREAWKHQRGGTHRLVERFLDRFWTSAFHRRRFQLRNPREVGRTLNELATQPLSVRSRRLLEAITDDFGITMPQEVRDWCRAS